jgi:EAL domain-containing protein (putative c-di-GMP-specific phosphodiesterase class I)
LHNRVGVTNLSVGDNAGYLPCIAEGVETAQQRDILRDIECQNVQGYFFSYPLREREVLSAFAKEVIEEGLCNV